jgi:hypothetical protein
MAGVSYNIGAWREIFREPTEREKESLKIELRLHELMAKIEADKFEQARKDRELLYKIAEKLGIDTK